MTNAIRFIQPTWRYVNVDGDLCPSLFYLFGICEYDWDGEVVEIKIEEEVSEEDLEEEAGEEGEEAEGEPEAEALVVDF